MSVIGCIFTFLGVTAILCVGGVICESEAVEDFFDRLRGAFARSRVKR